jgi:hypothetical protein
MEFQIKNLKKSINDIMRQIGYMPAFFQSEGEFSIVKKLGRNDYPRFHCYIVPAVAQSSGEAKQNGVDFTFKLHLDQKKPSYEGSTGHNGDYDGPVIEGEVERIKSIL